MAFQLHQNTEWKNMDFSHTHTECRHRDWAEEKPSREQLQAYAKKPETLAPNQVEQLEQEMGNLVWGPDAWHLVGRHVVWNQELQIQSQTVPTTAMGNTRFTHLGASPGSWKALSTQNNAFKLCLYRPVDSAIWPEAMPRGQGCAVYHDLPKRNISTASRMTHSLVPLRLSRGKQPHCRGLTTW